MLAEGQACTFYVFYFSKYSTEHQFLTSLNYSLGLVLKSHSLRIFLLDTKTLNSNQTHFHLSFHTHVYQW